jgi:hypothetical protein
MSPEQFIKRLEEQGGKCAICKIELSKPIVDHDHSCCSGRRGCGSCNRGLLCHSCNLIIGYANDSQKTLMNAIEYLKGFASAHA